MTIKGFYHVAMLNHWQEIVKEQIQLMIRSGLYDRACAIYIGCVGKAEDLNRLKKLIAPYEKLSIKVYSGNLCDYEFITLNYLWEKANKENHFFGFYIHTKGVSWPNPPWNEGGKYWRDYMNYYNLCKWRECYKKLIDGYDTCGVKYLTLKDAPANKAHYSGNFYWFKSSYVQRLKCPLKLNLKDRFEAEMWIGLGAPQAASLCQMFVDYRTIGKFQIPKQMRKIIIHTLAFNLPSEVEKTTTLIYEQNPGVEFKHYICDLGFPLEKGNEVPADVNKAKRINTEKLKAICQKYGSVYLEMPNIGVSQNWTQIIKHCNLADEDVIIGADPDERTLNNGWIKAMGTGLDQPKVGMVSLVMPEQSKAIQSGQWRFKDVSVNGTRLIEIGGGANWAMIGFNGKFCKVMDEVPYPKTHPRYGYIEHFVTEALRKANYRYLFLPEHRVYHTDWPKDDGSSMILRHWKNFIIFGDINQRPNDVMAKKYGQITLEKFIELRKHKVL